MAGHDDTDQRQVSDLICMFIHVISKWLLRSWCTIIYTHKWNIGLTFMLIQIRRILSAMSSTHMDKLIALVDVLESSRPTFRSDYRGILRKLFDNVDTECVTLTRQ